MGGENVSIDYLEFVSLDNLLVTPLSPAESSLTNSLSVSISSSSTSDSGSSYTSFTSSSSSVADNVFRVEAETMTLLGDYAVEANSASSGSALIGAYSKGEGIALTMFGGEAGYYNIVVGYYDENDTGIGQISAALNGETLDNWLLDQNLGDTSATAQNFLTRTVASKILLNTGDIFKLTSLRGLSGDGNDENARIDYVDFVQVDLANSNDNATNIPAEITSDIPIIIGEAIRIEAESMHLNGYSVESNSNPSGGRLITTYSSGTAKN